MDWHYSLGGQAFGPINETELSELLKSGKITHDTLVWKTGMEQWLPYRQAAGPVPPPLPATRCGVCGRPLPSSELILLQGTLVCAACKPAYLQGLKEGVPLVGQSMVWREGKILVLAKNATLPDRCVKCNAPTGYRLKRDLSWHQPLIYLTLLAGVLIYVIIAIVVSQKATIHVGLCERHRSQRRFAIGIGWGLVVLSILLFVLAGFYSKPILILPGLLAFFGGAIYGLVKGKVVTPKRIDKELVWLEGACKEYLDTLPARGAST